MNRREMLLRTGASALVPGLFGAAVVRAAAAGKRRILMYTKSETYEHDVVKRKDGKLSLAERIASELGARHGFEVRCEKDGRVFVNEDLGKYDGFLFETQGDLTKEGVDKQPPMPPEGKKALLQAVASGKGFVGCHCAADTFHTAGYPNNRWQAQSRDDVDPYLAMVGGEFISHGEQQRSWMQIVDKRFPGTQGVHDFGLVEEWYSLKNFAPDLHVILVQDTEGMRGTDYQRPKFPATWARRHDRGRVFYTSMGHRDDVWTNPIFQQLLLGGLAWAVGDVEADIAPNLDKVAPQASTMPTPPPKKK
jgi:type 1 glutamine amidotransferase